jgi:hypothetical protein
MGKLVVNCLNRPKDDMIEVSNYGLYKNMHTHDVPAVEGTLVVGFPLEEGKTLPVAKSSKASEPGPGATVKPAPPVKTEEGEE